MAKKKYKELEMEYTLADVPPMDKTKIPEKKAHILDGIRKRRAELGMNPGIP